MAEIIDAHHHFWAYNPQEYGWIDERMSVLRRDFLPQDLAVELRANGIDGCVAVQARQTVEETYKLLSLANEFPEIRGVVGWAPIASAQFPALLDDFLSHKKLKGLRHVVQDEPDENYLLRPEFNRGIELLSDRIAYDILVYERQLPQTIQFVDRHPRQTFVLDHIGKPRIDQDLLHPWRENMREFARRENVYCKLSGMATEAGWDRWSPRDLQPYFDVVLECFGPKRLMFGSDWPVCLLATSYAQWRETVSHAVEKFSPAEQSRIFGGTAIEAYRL